MKVVICGAGIAGITLALRLDALGWDVIVLERAAGPRTQGYMIDFFGPGYDTAEAMGVLPTLRALGYQVDEARYLDEAGRVRGSLSFRQFARTMAGRLVSIMRPDLEFALRERLSEDVDLRFTTSVAQVEQRADGVRLTLTDGSTLGADLLVGADGVHSTVRELVFGEESRYFRYLGFHTAAFIFTDPELHAQVRGGFCLTDTVDRELGFYGLRDGRVAAFTVHRAPDPTIPADVQAAVRSEYRSLGWIVPRALAACPPAHQVYYDQVAQTQVAQWSRGRVTLVGDACHAVSLLAGQGASLGMAGAYLLADQLDRAGSVETALHRYQERWQPIVTEKQQVARNGAKCFLPHSPLQLHIRRAAMWLSRLPGIDRYVASTLVGKSSAIIKELGAAGRGTEPVRE